MRNREKSVITLKESITLSPFISVNWQSIKRLEHVYFRKCFAPVLHPNLTFIFLSIQRNGKKYL